ncbi:increased DNA methylation 3-like isoform X3 [Olea europaea var. sylvestris]|uniref:increased DNA methylation 3-like isoform X3 n=1 Tax=Olea europaea var. sylvestris TaxID=158386 RepID=UPI000C1D8AB6|nr:increased DNA methylation 3-like isoform X3 [Olea europaea var. sylvestris]
MYHKLFKMGMQLDLKYTPNIFNGHFKSMINSKYCSILLSKFQVSEPLHGFRRVEITLWFRHGLSMGPGSQHFLGNNSISRSMYPDQNTASPKLKLAVSLKGTAKEGAIGPPLGLIDIGESEGNLKCDIHSDGSVRIEGVVADAQILKNESEEFELKLHQLCPAGPFTISFNLPGPVDPRLFSPSFQPDGILEVVVLKQRTPHVATEGA